MPRLFSDKHIESPRKRRLYRRCQRNEVHTGGEVLPNPITEPFFSLLSHPAAPPPGFFVLGRIMQRKLRCCPATSTPLEAVIRHTKHGAR
ncbi:hypothetical protein CWT15_08260 [Bifidobacterium longum]|nr:hypothetical protein CWT15_08260 [Bifidobacterium longum]